MNYSETGQAVPHSSPNLSRGPYTLGSEMKIFDKIFRSLIISHENGIHNPPCVNELEHTACTHVSKLYKNGRPSDDSFLNFR